MYYVTGMLCSGGSYVFGAILSMSSLYDHLSSLSKLLMSLSLASRRIMVDSMQVIANLIGSVGCFSTSFSYIKLSIAY